MAEKIVNPETHAPWQREFIKNIDVFVKNGVKKEKAEKLLREYMRLSMETPVPKVMKTFEDESALDEVGVYTPRQDNLRDFMIEFLKPLLKNFKVEGLENIKKITPILGKVPVTIVSNHLSHFDTAAMYGLLYLQGGEARKLADSMVFIAGRLVFLPDFTRLGLYMVNSLLVCSKKDMTDNPAMADIMTRINMRSFRQSQKLQAEGKVIAVFPEGTRSRTGRLLRLVDTVYHYVANKVILPVSLTGTDRILPTGTFLFNAASGQLSIGRPVVVGKLGKAEEFIPKDFDRLTVPPDVDKKKYIIDNLGLLIGKNLHKHRHGVYRNLYREDVDDKSGTKLITVPQRPKEKIVILGHTPAAVAAAAILANKEVLITLYTPDSSAVDDFMSDYIDNRYYPLYKLPPNIRYTSNPAEILEGTLFIQAARAWELDAIYETAAPILQKTTGPIINIIKGFTGTKRPLITDRLEKDFGLDPARFAVAAGANYPDQVMERKLTGFELAAINTINLNRLLKLFNTGYVTTKASINPYDIRGVQLGGALKSIYALGVGLLDGYYARYLGGNTDNTLFHLSNLMYAEMRHLGVALGGRASTFAGLSGVSDLMLACHGQDSHDRTYGFDFYNENKEGMEKFSAGYYGIRALPNYVRLKDKEHFIVKAIHAIVIQKRDKDKIINHLLDKVRDAETVTPFVEF
ncbi:MAG: glycerol-3-phosphate acyltransferase [Candidatus Hydrogenedentota bacterium]|nr:MAG: glycerol-3-phosphate acyltransferase [Candidatus Hydrogenedentota bacterium]